MWRARAGADAQSVQLVQPHHEVRPPAATGRPLGFHRLATGHHARVAMLGRPPRGSSDGAPTPQGPVVRALDARAGRVGACRLPRRRRTKDEGRAHARRLGLRTAGEAGQPVRVLHQAAQRAVRGSCPGGLSCTPPRWFGLATAARPAPSTPSSSSRWATRRTWATVRDGKRRYVTHVEGGWPGGSSSAARRRCCARRGVPDRAVADVVRPARCEPGATGAERDIGRSHCHTDRPSPCVVVRAGGTVEVIFEPAAALWRPGQTVGALRRARPEPVVGAGIAA